MATDELDRLEGHCEAAASAWIARFAGLARPGGMALDVAAGAGRHCRLFLGLGLRVTAVDRDVTALRQIGDSRLEVVEADLEAAPWPLPGRRFAAVVVANYLHRPLLPTLVEAVDDGGILLYETYAVGNERHGRPRNPDFLLRPGELLEAVRGRLTVLAYQHGTVERPRPAVVQRIAACRAVTKLTPLPIDPEATSA